LQPSARSQSSWSVVSTPFGGRGDAEAAAKAGDRAYDRNTVGALGEILHE
jgi:hypothetical protein